MIRAKIAVLLEIPCMHILVLDASNTCLELKKAIERQIIYSMYYDCKIANCTKAMATIALKLF